MHQCSEIISQFAKSGRFLLNRAPNDFICEPMKGGQSVATLFRFQIDNFPYVLRLFPPHAPPITRMHQLTLAKEAGELGFGPKIHFIDSEMNGIIMDFFPGRTIKEADFKDLANLSRFTKFIKHLHCSSAKFPKATSPFKRFFDLCLKMKDTDNIKLPQFYEIENLMKNLATIFQLLPIKRVPSHLDLHSQNIMVHENRFMLVDWVNGGISDPFFDLATFSVFHELNGHETNLFLCDYFEREISELEWNRFIVTKPIRLLVVALGLFSVIHNKTQAYEEIARLSLPTLRDFREKGAIWPHFILGMSMYQSALTIIDQTQFQRSLNWLKKYVNLRCNA